MHIPPAAILFLALLPVAAIAQPPAAQPKRTADPAVVELSDSIYNIDDVGLSIQLPAGSRVETTRVGDARTAQIVDANAKWVFNIQTPRTTNPKATIQEAAEQTIALIQGSVGVVDPDQREILETQARILERTPNLKVNGMDADRFYIAVPRADGKPLVKGYTIFKPSATQYVVFELIVAEADFAGAKRAYETSVGTSKFLDPALINTQRGAAIRAGQELLKQITAEDYDQWFNGQEIWYRLYRPASTASKADAEEIGYRGIKLWKGQRGEVDPGSRRSWTRVDRQQGYLASVRARLLTSQGPADSEAIYFMSADRTEEAWSLRMVVRDSTGREILTAKEVGARTNKDLSVVIEQTGQPPRTIQPFFQSEGYISQVEAIVLPRAFSSKQVVSDFAFYGYQSQLESVSMRRDKVSKSGRGTSTVWSVETSFTDDAPAQTSTYNSKGELLSTVTGDGRIWEPTKLETLKGLWEQKGLPTAAPKAR